MRKHRRRCGISGRTDHGLALLSCDESDAPLVAPFLEREVRVIECSPRPPVPRWRQQVAAHRLPGGASQPSCPIYSAAVGRRLASADLGALRWSSSPERSFYFDEALADAFRDGFEVLITTGDEPPQARAVAGRLDARVTIIRTLGPPGSESRAWHHASRRARGLSLSDRRVGPIGPRASASPATFDFRDPRVAQDPYPCFEELRHRGPIHWLPRHHAWLVLDYADVSQILLSSSSYEVPGMTNTGIDKLRREDVAELRRLMRTWLSGDLVERVAVEAKSVADELVRRGRADLDVVGGLAQPLSEYVAGRLLGLDPSAIQLLSDALDLGEREPNVGLFVEASAALTDMPVRVPIADELQRAPWFSQTQANSFIRDFWVAAALTSRFAIPSAVLLLLEQYTLQAQLRADPGLIPAFVAEALRLHPPHHTIERTATSDMVVAGTTVPAGSELCAVRRGGEPRPRSVRRSHQRPPRPRAAPPLVRLWTAPLPRGPRGAEHGRCCGGRTA